MSKNSEDDIKLDRLKKEGAEADLSEGTIYFDSQPTPRPRSQSLSNIPLRYEESVFYDTASDESRTNSISSLDRKYDESSLTDHSKASSPLSEIGETASPSVKTLKAQYERKTSSPQTAEEPTIGTKGRFAGLGIEKIREDIREAVDPHTYQKVDGIITKSPYKNKEEGKSSGRSSS